MQGAIANYAHFESMQKGLETFFQDADKGKAKFEELRKMSNETTFGVDELANSFTQLANVGVDVDTIRDKLMMLGDVSQGNKQVFAELVSIYSKINATGKASSVAIQQLALRGLPIYDMLKKIGVQGTATADDITKALQEMTKEGGQFHDAMNNINDTIEGKQGFLSDYLKEMSVNFADLVGLADDYKNILDVLNNVVASVSDKFLEWNNNPMSKAILGGVFKSAIAGLAGIIVTALVPALIKVLGLLGMFNPVVLLGGLAGAGIALVLSYLNQVKVGERELNEELREQKKLREEIAGIGNLTAGSSSKEISKEKEELESMLTLYDKIANYDKGKVDFFSEETPERIDYYKKRIEELTKKMKLAEEAGDSKKASEYNTAIEERQKKLKALTAEYDLLTIAQNKTLSDDAIKQAIADTQDAIEIQKRYEKTLKTIDDNNPYAKQLKDIEELTSQIEDLNNASEAKGIKSVTYENGLPQYEYDLLININPAYKQKIDEAKKYAEEKLQKVQIDLDFEKTDDWRKQIQNILKMDKKDVISGTGTDVINTYVANRQKQMQAFLNKNTIASELGLNTSDISKQILAFAQDSFKQINALLDTGNFSATDNSIVALRNNIEVLRTQFINMNGSAKDFDKALGSVIDTTKNFSLGDDIKNSVLSGISGTDVGDFVENLRNGGTVIGSFISVLVKDLISLVGGMDKVQYILNIIKNLLDALSPLLEAIVNIVAILGVILKPILTLLKNFLNFIFKDFNDSMDELYNSIQDETEARKSSTKSLVESYEKLCEAIKEQQEYYLKRKQELNSDTYKEGVVRKVNDMILTDKGVFSTSPQDTIMAMKKPESLLGAGNTNINVKVIDNVGVNTNVRQEGNNLLIELLSQKVAVDYSDGSNGWGGAVQRQHQTSGGRSLSL